MTGWIIFFDVVFFFAGIFVGAWGWPRFKQMMGD